MKQYITYFFGIAIIGILVWMNISQKNRFNRIEMLNESLIQKAKKDVANREKQIKNDSLVIMAKFDSLQTRIRITESELTKENKNLKKQLNDIRKIKSVGDFNRYNDSLSKFIQSMRHE